MPDRLAQRTRRVYVAVALVWLAVFAMRMLTPDDLTGRDQEIALAYILDVAYQGDWICPLDHHGDPASKPPLQTWLGALAVLALGNTRFAVSLPSALATLGLALWIARQGILYFGNRAAGLAAISYLLCTLTMRHLPVVRTDPIFSLTVALAAGAAFRAWRRGTSWHPFWILATLATLTKGPLGLLLALGGLVAILWMRRDGEPWPRFPRWWTGAIYYVLVSGGWFLLAWWDKGQMFIDEVLWEELVGHVITNDKGQPLYWTFWHPTAYFLGRYVPWSLFSVPAFLRVFRQPAGGTEERAWERFCLCWFGVGMLVFSFVAHKRADLLAPIMAPAVLLTGREMARIARAWPARRFLAAATVATLVMFGVFTAYNGVYRARKDVMRDGVAARQFAHAVRDGIDDVEVYAVQFHLGTYRSYLHLDEAVAALAADEPAYLVAWPAAPVLQSAADRGIAAFVLHEGDRGIVLVSNRPRLGRFTTPADDEETVPP
jgi:4-amino-4-deoxy-L-arabinose transferase-like glycosyltransferase